MPHGFAYNLAMALIPGAIAGYYSGLLVAKQAKFNALKHEALRCIRSINFVGDDSQTDLLTTERVNELHLVASELLHLGHRKAGERMLTVARSAEGLVASCKMAAVPVNDVIDKISAFQREIRSLNIGPRLLLPWGHI